MIGVNSHIEAAKHTSPIISSSRRSTRLARKP
jgi:hypothetical protein